MIYAIPFPDISPEIFTLSLGSFAFSLRWYALAYIAGLVFAWWLAKRLIAQPALWPGRGAPMDAPQLEDFMTWAVLGVVLGGRLGFVVFYQPAYYAAHPLEILQIWQGGMAFHGGMLGVIVAAWLWCWRNGAPFLSLVDLAAVVACVGLGLGRVANFINAELWGRPTDVPWGVIFPGQAAQACATDLGPCVRHPSQLYQAGLEGVILFAVLLWLATRAMGFKRPGLVGGAFVAGYGVARWVVEVFRQADAHYITPDNPLGHVAMSMTMGQLLSLPMIAVGVVAITWALRRGPQ